MASGYDQYIRAASRRWRIPEAVIRGLIQVESGGNEGAISPAGAFGLTQFMPGTARSYGVRRGNPRSQIYGAAHYLNDLGYGKDPRLALSSYNAGPGNPGAAGDYAEKVLAAAKRFGGGGAGMPVPAGSSSPPTGAPTPAAPSTNLFRQFADMNRTLGLTDENDPVQKNWEFLAGALDRKIGTQSTPTTDYSPTSFDTDSTQGLEPGGGWSGTQAPVQQLTSGLPVKVTSTKRDRKFTSSGNISDHWKGNKRAYAEDISGSKAQMDQAFSILGQRIGRKLTYNAYNNIDLGNGLRLQIIYGPKVGHGDHIHVGVIRR